MAKLTAKKRDALPASKFAGPDKSYPVPDRSHAANAKARASQAVNSGRMSKSTEAKIDAKANKVLDGKKKMKPTRKVAALPKPALKPAPKLAGAADRSLNAKADAVVARLNKPKPLR